MTEIASKAAKGTSAFIVQSAISGFLRVINLSILTRLLTQAGMGQIAILGVIYGFMQFLGALGLNHASPLFIPEKTEEGKLGKVKGFLNRSVVLITASSSTLAFVVFLFLSFIIEPTGLSPELLILVLIVGPFSSLQAFLDSFLMGKYDVAKLSSGRVLYDIIRVLATVGLVIYGFGVTGVIIGWLISEFVAVCVYLVGALVGLRMPTEKIELIPILTFALPNLAFQTIDVTIQNTDRIILLHLTNFATLGVYDVFLRVLFMFSFFSLTVASSLYPLLTKLRIRAESAENTDERLGAIIVHLVRYILIVLMPVAIIAAFNSRVILAILFGPRYADFPNASLSFALLVLSYAIWGVVYALHTVLRSMGEGRFFVVSGLSIIIFEIIGAWYLTSVLGLLGSAIIRVAYIILLFVAATLRLWQLGVRGLSSALGSTGRIAVASIVGGFVTFLASPQTVFGLILFVFLGGIVYMLLLFAGSEILPLDFIILLDIIAKRFQTPLDKLRRLYLGERAE